MKKIKVRAVGEDGVVAGYYGDRRRRGGEVFIIDGAEYKDNKTGKIYCEFSPKWMEKVGDDAVSVPYVKQVLREPVPLSQANKAIHEGVIDKPTVKKEDLEEVVADKEPVKEVKSTGDKDVI